MRQLRVTMVLLVLSLTAQAADLSGDWAGTIQLSGQGQEMSAFLRLQHDDEAVTGEAGPNAKQLFPIKHASFRNNRLHIETSADSPVVLMFELTLENKRLTG
jgi:hypothetical protein